MLNLKQHIKEYQYSNFSFASYEVLANTCNLQILFTDHKEITGSDNLLLEYKKYTIDENK